MKIHIRSSLFFLLFLLSIINVPFLHAQQSRNNFGKNRVQYKEFNWRFFSSENFDIYFYDDGQTIAKQASEYLEDEFDKITDILGYAPYAKTKIFIYNSVSDLQQSNVGLNENNFTIGGQTNFVKLQVELAYPGTTTEFKDELLFKVSQVLIKDMMFGGSLTDVLQNAYLMSLPKWFIDGAALYIAKGWDISMDDHIRDLLQHRKVKKMNKLTGPDAELAGQAIWNFIAERYGRSNISNILNLTRIIRNEESSISNTLGIPFKLFLSDWQNYYKEMSAHVQENYVLPADENRIGGSSRKYYSYNNVKISPNGLFLAYSEGENGKYRVIIRNLENGKEVTALTGGFKIINQEVNEDIPLLAWKDNNTLGIINSKSGRNVLWLYDLGSKKKQKRELENFNQINSVSFSTNGNVVVLNADVKGQNDLFLLSLTRFNVRRLTNDIFDDLQPRFLPDRNAIIFSSNRVTDSLNVKTNTLAEAGNNFNLYLFDIDTTKNVLQKVTKTISRDIYPIPSEEGSVYYLSDQKGIYNIFRYNISDSLYRQVTNYFTSIKDYDLNTTTGQLAFTMLYKGRDYVHYVPNLNVESNVFTPATKRNEALQAKIISQRLLESRERRLKKQQEAPQPPQEEIITDTEGLIEEIEIEKTPQNELIDTDNYVFDRDVIESEESSSFLSNYRKLRKKNDIQGPFPYETRFSTDNVITSWVIDPLRGFGIQLEIEMNDMLENHKFYGGVMAITDLRSGDIFAEYQYLKNRIDYHGRYERKSIFRQDETQPKKYVLDKFEVGASLPLNNSSRITFSPFVASTKFVDLDIQGLSGGPQSQDLTLTFGGARLEYVFDNTLVKGLNLFEGTRAKVRLEHFEGLSDQNRGFTNLRIDVRNYQKIHRELVFATRLFYGGSYGRNKQSYLLGGMDNWLFFKTDNDPSDPNNPLANPGRSENSNLLFTEFVTNMRGFNYNKFNGNNAALFNAELRFPIIKYFTSGPIASNFFRNLQLIGFYDIGSAWSGSSPFSEENSLNTEFVEAGHAFDVKIKNFKNPWISSYGTGLRTVLLGYYVKFDVAWPIEDYIVEEPRFYVTLGYDF